ncbi:unnamed protein product [Victoria cruziana]
MASPSLLEGEWEVCNDHGFVYKRRKRDPSAGTHTVVPPAPSAYPGEESRLRKELRKKALLQLKDKYGKEIEQWEQLEQILRTTREKAESSIVECKQIEPSEDELRPPSALQDSASNVLIDDILFQVEAQDSILQDLDGLCATAEAICDAHEESIKQSLLDLPVWADPLSIMKDLSVLNADSVQ